MPKEAWCGYNDRTVRHLVTYENSELLPRWLGWSECEKICIRPYAGCDYKWTTLCRQCFPEQETHAD